jgi:hypothetical protein
MIARLEAIQQFLLCIALLHHRCTPQHPLGAERAYPIEKAD